MREESTMLVKLGIETVEVVIVKTHSFRFRSWHVFF